MASIVAAGMFSFVPVSAAGPERLASPPAASPAQAVFALNATETPPALPWDMIFGDPSQASTPETADEYVTDMSIG